MSEAWKCPTGDHGPMPCRVQHDACACGCNAAGEMCANATLFLKALATVVCGPPDRVHIAENTVVEPAPGDMLLGEIRYTSAEYVLEDDCNFCGEPLDMCACDDMCEHGNIVEDCQVCECMDCGEDLFSCTCEVKPEPHPGDEAKPEDAE